MFGNLFSRIKRIGIGSKKEENSNKDEARKRLHLVLLQDRADVSADFLDMMTKEIVDVIKKYVDVDEDEIEVELTNKQNSDGTIGAPALYANIPIKSIKSSTRALANKDKKSMEKENDIKKKKTSENKQANTKEKKVSAEETKQNVEKIKAEVKKMEVEETKDSSSILKADETNSKNENDSSKNLNKANVNFEIVSPESSNSKFANNVNTDSNIEKNSLDKKDTLNSAYKKTSTKSKSKKGKVKKN